MGIAKKLRSRYKLKSVGRVIDDYKVYLASELEKDHYYNVILDSCTSLTFNGNHNDLFEDSIVIHNVLMTQVRKVGVQYTFYDTYMVALSEFEKWDISNIDEDQYVDICNGIVNIVFNKMIE